MIWRATLRRGRASGTNGRDRSSSLHTLQLVAAVGSVGKSRRSLSSVAHLYCAGRLVQRFSTSIIYHWRAAGCNHGQNKSNRLTASERSAIN